MLVTYSRTPDRVPVLKYSAVALSYNIAVRVSTIKMFQAPQKIVLHSAFDKAKHAELSNNSLNERM